MVRVRAGGIKALKHLNVYVDHAGTSNRLNAKRAWTGPLFEASAVVTCAVDPRSRPEQQRMTEIEASRRSAGGGLICQMRQIGPCVDPMRPDDAKAEKMERPR